jgi:hypothetical protein
MANGLKWQQELVEERENEESEFSATAIKELERVKWFLWHGNVVRALESVEALEDLVAAREQTEDSHKLEKALEEFHTYIRTTPI